MIPFSIHVQSGLVILPQKHLNKKGHLGEYEIKATSSYVQYMQIETPISFKPWDQRMVRSFLKLKDISHVNFMKTKTLKTLLSRVESDR